VSDGFLIAALTNTNTDNNWWACHEFGRSVETTLKIAFGSGEIRTAGEDRGKAQ